MMWKLSPHILVPYILRVAFVVGVISGTVQLHCVYKPHRFFLSYLFPETVTSRQQFENRLETMGDNEFIELQCKSFHPTLMGVDQTERQSKDLISEKDAACYLFCEMEDGVFLVKRPALDLKDLSARVTVDFGNMGEDLSNALFLATAHKLFLSPRELAKRLVQFSFIEYSSGNVALLAGMYLFFGGLLPVGYVVVQMKRLDLRRFLQLVWEDRPGRVLLLLLLVVIVVLNLFIYLSIRDINSFKGGKWRNPKKHTEDFNRVIEMVEEEPAPDTLLRLKTERQSFLSSFLQEEITKPLKLIQAIATKNKILPEKELGILLFDQAGERRIFRLTGKEYKSLYRYGYRISAICLEADSNSIEEEDYLSSKGVTRQRKYIVWQKQIMENWKIQNQIAEITNEISVVADCENKKIFWLFDKKYYVAHPMQTFIDMGKHRSGK